MLAKTTVAQRVRERTLETDTSRCAATSATTRSTCRPGWGSWLPVARRDPPVTDLGPSGLPVRSSLRLWVLLAATLGWLWASSVFAPWAADRAPRLWLYDLLFYLRVVLLAWAAAEVLRCALRRTWPRPAEA